MLHGCVITRSNRCTKLLTRSFDWLCSYSQNAIIFSKRVRTPVELNVSRVKCGGKPRDLRHVYLHLAGSATKGEQRYRIWFVSYHSKCSSQP